jgi:hypothetical protein
MERVLGVAIGIATVCLLLSIIASHLQEVWASYTARRAASLTSAIENMLGKTIAADFFNHPLIETISFTQPRVTVSLQEGKKAPAKLPKDETPHRPTYIAASLFSRVLFAVLKAKPAIEAVTSELPSPNTQDTPQQPASPVFELLKKLEDGDPLKRRLSAVIAGTQQDVHASVLAVEQWYDGTMDRINGLYKKNTQQILLYFGIVLAILCNANMFSITEKLWTSEDARAALNATAQMYNCKDSANCTGQSYESARNEMAGDLESYIPVGYHRTGAYWKGVWAEIHKPDATAVSYLSILWGWTLNLAGWGLTGIAVSLGAPFWFDAVNKLINIRLAGDKPARTQPPAIGGSQPQASDTALVLAPQMNAPVVNVNLPDQLQADPGSSNDDPGGGAAPITS